MLLRLKIKNFLSFHQEMEFNMFPNLNRKSFTNHIYNDEDLRVPILKLTAIYGANGSGKSNILESFNFLKKFAIEKDFLDSQPQISINKFRLVSLDNNEPIELSVELYANKQIYIYNTKINDSLISEELFLSGIGKTNDRLIFSRSGSNIHIGGGEKIDNDLIDNLLIRNPKSSIISLNKEFPVIKDKSLNIIYDWFVTNTEYLSLQRKVPSLISMFYNNKEMFSLANDVINKIGLGVKELVIDSKGIENILGNDNEGLKNAIIEKLEQGSVSQMKNDRTLLNIVKEKDEVIVRQLLFKHVGINNFESNLEYECQSDGTVKILNLIPAIYNIINKECLYFIDEIENSIHPILIKKLIQYIANLKTKGQLIFTTHETELLNQKDVLRPDEVWLTEKYEGSTKLYSLNDFKIHNTINIKNGYLEGRYGGIPFIGNLEILDDEL
ncbi:MAG: ATP-binding protein [Bacteroidales bacterium]|nr:ATP-binding protein [Bacteroidales bacterium]